MPRFHFRQRCLPAVRTAVLNQIPNQTFSGPLRLSEGGIALIQRTLAGKREWLAQWNENWKAFFFIGGHREGNETFRACVIREKRLHSNHPSLAAYYRNLGLVERLSGNLSAARRLLQRALKITENFGGAVASLYEELAGVELDAGNHSVVIAFVRKAYHGWRAKYGPSHPKTKEMREWLVENDPEFDPNT